MRGRRALLAVAVVALGLLVGPLAGPGASTAARTYLNPVPATTGTRSVDNCPDPNVFRGAGRNARHWYLFCTSDPLDDHDAAAVPRRSTTLPMLRSDDLVHWRLVGAATSARPSWAAPGAALWAPDVTYSATYGRYYLTFAVTDVVDRVSGEPGCTSDRAIGVAVSASPTGPWTPSRAPLVAPQRLGPGCDFASTIDPDLLEASGTTPPVLYFGSFRGGVQAAPVALSRTGMRLTRAPRGVTTGRRYEAPDVVRHGGWYFLTVSAGDCCNGARSGYSVFTGRSRSPYGPFLDRTGVSLLDSRTGGTPVVAAMGNRWLAPGHTSMFVDRGGAWWMAYHAVDAGRPYLAGGVITRRPALVDPVDWVGGWPTVRAGRGPSSTPVPVPAAAAGQRTAYRPSAAPADLPGVLDAARSDDFDGDALDPRWTWVREPDAVDREVSGGALRVRTRATSLYTDPATAPVLTEEAPAGDFVVETQVDLDLPATGCCFGATQAGLVVYAGDDSYLKLVHVASAETRQVAFSREVPTGAGRFGSTYVGPPGRMTWLRVVRTKVGATQVFRAYSSRDGRTWVRGSTWRADDLAQARIGLTAGGGDGSTAVFDHLRVWSLTH